MKITIIYDNKAWNKDLKPDWGFSCLVEAFGKSILFDTGAKGDILLDNMKKLNIDPLQIDEVFISHSHRDHTGGLASFLRINQTNVYIPYSCIVSDYVVNVVKVKERVKIHENIYSTGELKGIEQSLVIKQDKGVIVIVGCSHPGVREIFKEAAIIGKVSMLVGGLHGFNEFELINDLDSICPTHCTQSILKIKEIYPAKYVEGGAAQVIEI